MLCVIQVGCITSRENLCPCVNPLFLTRVYESSPLKIKITSSLSHCYGPYEGKHEFWDFFRWILRGDKVIIGGDLNFTLNRANVWAVSTRFDLIVEYFKFKI